MKWQDELCTKIKNAQVTLFFISFPSSFLIEKDAGNGIRTTDLSIASSQKK
jgi:hypothetical protein